jgi:Polyketide synthase dehydratase
VGPRIKSTDKEFGYEARYGVQHTGYLSDHRVLGTVVLPTTVELEAATAAGRIHFGAPAISLEDAMHHQAMTFADRENRTVRILLTPLTSERASFRLVSAAADNPAVWHTHMTGTLRKSGAPGASAFSAQQVQARCVAGDVGTLYDRLSKLGLEYGPSFNRMPSVAIKVAGATALPFHCDATGL